jgi:hypothetical protein
MPRTVHSLARALRRSCTRNTSSHSAPALKLALALAFAAGLGAGMPSASAADFALTASGLIDEDSGSSYDLDLRVSPSDAWSLSAGLGRSGTDAPGSDFAGTSWRAAGGWQGSRVGVGFNAVQWQDDGQFESQTLGADLTVTLPAGFMLTALLRQRDLEVSYSVVGLLNRLTPVTTAFDGSGYGAELSWFNESWGLSLRSVTYSYDSSLDRVRAAAASPATRGFPRLQALTDSMLTRAFGATDREFGASVERRFSRSGLALNVGGSRETLTGESVTSLGVSYRYALSPRVDLEGTLGSSDGDTLGSLAYAGLSATFRL